MANEVKDAKMICKSIDALRKEIHMLRMDMLHGEVLKEQMKDLDESAEGSPLYQDEKK